MLAGALADWEDLPDVVDAIYASRRRAKNRPAPDFNGHMYCFDTDVLSAAMRRDPPMHLIRRLATVPSEEQSTTAVTLGELLYGAAKRGSEPLQRVRDLVIGALDVFPFDEEAAEVYGVLRADLESKGRRLDEPDLRIASITRSRDLTLVTGNVRHFDRVPGLVLENWLAS